MQTVKENKQTEWKRINEELVKLITDHISGDVENEYEWKSHFTAAAKALSELAEEMDRECVVTFPDGDMAGIWYHRYQDGFITLDDFRSVPYMREVATFHLWDEDDVKAFLEENGSYYL